MTDIIKRETITEMVNSFNKTVECFERALAEAEKAQVFFKIFSDYKPFSVNLSASSKPEIGLPPVKRLASRAWRTVINKIQITEIMTTSKREKLDEQLEACSMPDFTVDNIYSTLNDLYNRSEDLLKESVKEAFETLRPSTVRLSALSTLARFQACLTSNFKSKTESTFTGGFYNHA